MTSAPPCLREFDVGEHEFRVKIEGSDKVITCQKNEALLIAMERQGYAKIPVGCRNGGCGICKIRVVEGEFEVGKMSIKHVSAEEREKNFTLACKTFPKTDLLFAVVRRKGRVIDADALGFGKY